MAHLHEVQASESSDQVGVGRSRLDARQYAFQQRIVLRFVIKAPKGALRAQAVEKSKQGPMTKAHPQQYRPPFGRLKEVIKTPVNEQAKGRERCHFQSFRVFCFVLDRL